jgi:NAD(P)-dependent dehydrogenase (short-subunit alcohol dehydrogenase family)
MMPTGLHGKVVLITGANNPAGIGAATARAFGSAGAKVALTYLRLAPETHGFSTVVVFLASESSALAHGTSDQGLRWTCHVL